MYNRFYIRTDDWLLIGDNRGQERSLYDLRQDPHEFFDVVPQNPRRERGPLPAGARGGRRPAALLRVGDAADARDDQQRPLAVGLDRSPTQTAARRAAITTLVAHGRPGAAPAEPERGEHQR